MIRRELGFFILNGIVSVTLAYFIYRVLVTEEILGVNSANGVAYISGMIYGFFSNRKWAFQDRELVTGAKLTRYVFLHAFTLVVNISVNAIMLKVIFGMYGDILFSFLLAISFSTVLNFLGLKYLVFNQSNSIVADMKKLKVFLL